MSVLHGVNVLNLSRSRCGAYAAIQLADYGARVTRVGESPDSVTDYALYGDAPYTSANADITVLLDNTDVLLTEQNTLPAGMTRDILRRRWPKLVCAVIREDAESGGALAEAESGMMDMTGFPNGAPTLSGGHAAECFAGVSLSFVVISLLQGAREQGDGAWIDYSLYDTYYSLLESPILFRELQDVCPTRCGSADPATLVPYDVFRCRDGYFSAGLASDAGWDRFCDAIGMPELYRDTRFDTNEKRCGRYEEMTEIFSGFFRKHTRAELQEIFTAANIPNAPVLSAAEAAEHPQILARNMVSRVASPYGEYLRINSPVKMSVSRPAYEDAEV